MVVHESHCVAFAGQAPNALPEGGDEVVQAVVQDVGEHGAFEVSPQPLNQVQAGAVGRQPVDGDLLAMLLQPGLNRFRGVEAAVVADQDDLLSHVLLDQGHQENQELGPALGRRQSVGQLACFVVHATIDNLLLILSGSRNFGLLADRSPHSRQRRMAVDLHFVLKDQHGTASFLKRPFLKRFSSRRAFLYFASSRLPFIVCLGRWKENPSSRKISRRRSSPKLMPVCCFRWALSRATDHTLKPYPSVCGWVWTACRSAARYSGVARERRPVDLPGRKPARPCLRYRWRTLSTVAGQHPNSLAIDSLDRPTPDIKMIVALRNTATSVVENRNSSRTSHSLSVSFHRAMREPPCRERNTSTRIYSTVRQLPNSKTGST